MPIITIIITIVRNNLILLCNYRCCLNGNTYLYHKKDIFVGYNKKQFDIPLPLKKIGILNFLLNKDVMDI